LTLQDGSGKISISEFKEIFGGAKSMLSEKDWKKLISEADENNDGEVTTNVIQLTFRYRCPNLRA
jgi:Ca2+-binding EF-hand superfamily protein